MRARMVLAIVAIVAVVAVVLALAGAGRGCGAAGHSPPGAGAMHTAVVQQGELVDRVLLTGALHPTSALELVAPNIDYATLTISWIAKPGTAVKAGDRVLVFDASPFSNKLQGAHADLREAELRRRLAKDEAALNLEDKKLEVRKKQNDRDKARLLAEVPSELTTGRAVQESKLSLVQSEAALARAEHELAAMIEKAALEERAGQIELDKTRRSIETAEHALDALVMKAPRDGMVVINPAPENGHKFQVKDDVRAGTEIAALPDLTKPMEVRGDVIDVDDGSVDLHMAGTCTLDGYPAEPLPCTVEALAPVARPKANDSLRHSFSVTLALGHGNPARLRPGMAVKIELHRQSLHALVVPRCAVLRDPPTGGARGRVRLGTGEIHDVMLAACDAQQCAIASGLTEGDVVSLEAPGGRS